MHPDDQRLIFPAAARNREPIAAVLRDWLPPKGSVLELASGSGEHAIAFQNLFPALTWQASDPDPTHRSSINAWIAHAGLHDRMPSALELDVLHRPWPLPEPLLSSLSAMVCINLLHISPPECSQALIEQAGCLLPKKAPLLIYGPFKCNGHHTSRSNAAFDTSLRQRHPDWGLRDLEWIEQLAAREGFNVGECRSMPANNLTLVLQRR